jgi:TonB family protein
VKKILPVVLGAILAGCSAPPAARQTPVYSPVSFTGRFVYIVNADVPPKLLFPARPIYPFNMRAAQLSGNATIGFIVEVDGTTSQVQVVNATDPAFGDSARECVTKWRFHPGEKAGRPVRVAMDLPIVFTLNKDGGS